MATARSQPSNIVYDETPIHVYMQRIHQRLVDHGRVSFSEMFQSGAHKSALIGVFLAILELVRHHSVRTEQANNQGEIVDLARLAFRSASRSCRGG